MSNAFHAPESNLRTEIDRNESARPLSELETAEILQSLRSATAENPTSLSAEPELPLDLQPAEPGTFIPASSYWDASTMAPLNPTSVRLRMYQQPARMLMRSKAALARLRAYKPPPFPTWDRLPVTRRAAVLILLFADRRGDLRVVITMRAAALRNFSGHAAFPGGKADSLQETPYQIARREAWEEIGLPMDDAKIPKPFRIEELCCLPCSLAKTELAVRPCIAFLHADDTAGKPSLTVEESMIPTLDAKEVAAVFSAPLHNFLKAADEPHAGSAPLPEGHWYDGRWSEWHGKRWRVHNFYVPINNQKVGRPSVREGGQAALAEFIEEQEDQRFQVWGMTGRMLVDTARIAYEEEPEFEHNKGMGEESIIDYLENQGRLPEKKRKEVGQEAVKEDDKPARI